MFLIRLAFWLGLVVLLLPTDERQQARLYGTAVATVERVTTFCDRNAQALRRRRRLLGDVREEGRVRRPHCRDLVSSSGRKDEERL